MSQMATVLQQHFAIAPEEIEKALSYQRKHGGQLEQILISLGSLSSEMLPQFYSQLFDLPLIEQIPDPEWTLPDGAQDLPLEDLLEHRWLPYQLSDGCWLFYTLAPFDKFVLETLDTARLKFQFVLVTPDVFNPLRAIAERASQDTRPHVLSSVEEARLRELASEAPTVQLLNNLITRGLKQRASDMHVEPFAGKGKVRFRIDGVLQDAEVIPSSLLLPIITRLKILSNMDIAEKRRPQDGKIEMRISGIELDIRVSSLPLNDGESVVMRFLRKDSIQYDMNVLGIAPDIEAQINADLQKTAGVVLLTGPTGSGKTTSLYTFLNKLNSPQVKIITLEDPVEYQLDGINQVQVQSDIGFDFATGLRSIVRQDPDIIMLGEIRDKETAAIAMQSALTGHLVFSTVHTNDAPSAYTRLLDLGVEEFLLNAALISIVAQRLVRCLCPHCKVAITGSDVLIDKFKLGDIAKRAGVNTISLFEPVGCELCNFTGYRGRVAVIEYMKCDGPIQDIRKDHNFIRNARQVNLERGGRTLLQDGLLKAVQGITTIDEVIRAAG
jgi:general secretion pathway protein E